jgi:hypothetical protein
VLLARFGLDNLTHKAIERVDFLLAVSAHQITPEIRHEEGSANIPR